jgi:UDP-N-acetylmuramate dehydrogenase
MNIQEGVALAPFTTFHIGGPAKYFAEVTTVPELYQALDFARDTQARVLVLGGGSNILLPDQGFDGLVIKIAIDGIERVEEDDTTLMVSGAGEDWDAYVAQTIEQNLWGLENLSGIPGTVGGAVAQNIGAYGAALSQTLEWVEVLDTHEQITKTIQISDCKFGYRDSIFKQLPGHYIVLYAAFRLSRMPKRNLSYKDLSERFQTSDPALPEIRKAVLEIRRLKFPDISIEGTAGSFFKNLIVNEVEAKKLQEKYPGMPVFSIPESLEIKIPLGWILDHVLKLRGYKNGNVRLFEKQALVVVADKNTSSQEVQDFMYDIQKKVFDECAINIEPEVHIVVR